MLFRSGILRRGPSRGAGASGSKSTGLLSCVSRCRSGLPRGELRSISPGTAGTRGRVCVTRFHRNSRRRARRRLRPPLATPTPPRVSPCSPHPPRRLNRVGTPSTSSSPPFPSASGRRLRAPQRRRPASPTFAVHGILSGVSRRTSPSSLPPPPCSVPLSLRASPSAAAPVTAVVASGDHKAPSAALPTPRGRALPVHLSMPPLVVEFERAVQGRAAAPHP